MMRIYVIALNKANQKIRNLISEAYPGSAHYKITDTSFLVRTDKLAEDVAREIGLKGEQQTQDALGVVFKINSSYSGFNERGLWDWLRAAEEMNE